MNCTSSALLSAPSTIVVSMGAKIHPRGVRFSWIVPARSSPKVTASQVADATVAICSARWDGASARASASVSARSRRATSSAARRSARVCPARNCRRAWLRWNPTIGKRGSEVAASSMATSRQLEPGLPVALAYTFPSVRTVNPADHAM